MSEWRGSVHMNESVDRATHAVIAVAPDDNKMIIDSPA